MRYHVSQQKDTPYFCSQFCFARHNVVKSFLKEHSYFHTRPDFLQIWFLLLKYLTAESCDYDNNLRGFKGKQEVTLHQKIVGNESDLLTDFQKFLCKSSKLKKKIVKISYSYAIFIMLYPNYLEKEIYSYKASLCTYYGRNRPADLLQGVKKNHVKRAPLKNVKA